MPARKKSRFQVWKPEKAEIILLTLPLVVLAVLIAFQAASSKPAPAAPLTPIPQNAAAATPAASIPAPAAPTTPTTAPATATSAAAAVTATTAASPTTATSSIAASITPVKTIIAGSPAGKGIRLSKTVGGLKFDMLVSPGHIGDNTYDLLLSENGNQAVRDASLVRLTVNSLDMDMGVAQLDLIPSNQPGLYSGEDHRLQMLSMFGKYRVQVLVKRPARDDVTTSFDVSVTSS